MLASTLLTLPFGAFCQCVCMGFCFFVGWSDVYVQPWGSVQIGLWSKRAVISEFSAVTTYMKRQQEKWTPCGLLWAEVDNEGQIDSGSRNGATEPMYTASELVDNTPY